MQVSSCHRSEISVGMNKIFCLICVETDKQTLLPMSSIQNKIVFIGKSPFVHSVWADAW